MNSIYTELPISRVMTTIVRVVALDTPLSDILKIFESNTFHNIPVLDGERLQGIISKSDFYRVSHLLSIGWDGEPCTQCAGDHALTAANVMTKSPVQLDPDDSIGLAADIVLSNKFHALPVVANDRLVGILTAHDLLQYAYAELGFHQVSQGA
jgi:CBS domain-containing protein